MKTVREGRGGSVSGLALVLALAMLCAAVIPAACGEGESWVCPSCGMIVMRAHGDACPVCGLRMPTEPTPTPAQTRNPYPKAGDYITFGRYPQTAEGTDQTPIEWLVLEVDEENHRALLLSQYGLDAKPYNAEYNKNVTWEMCTLRAWLNGEFLKQAFTAEEQGWILLTNVDNSRSQRYSGWSASGGNNTQDKVFLLSYAEANKYLGVTHDNRNNTKSRVALTAYAVKQEAFTSSSAKTADGTAAGWWWLRSPANRQDCAAGVTPDGSLDNYYVNYDYGCVRPALWVNLESGIF